MIKTIKFKKILYSALIFMLIVIISFGVTFGVYYNKNLTGERPEITARAENVILLIGDGMGFNLIEIASYFDTPIMTTIEEQGSMTTRSRYLIFPATDSAASATAMATGTKAWNGNVSYLRGNELKHLGEYTKENDKKLGIITTKSVTDATPAAFSAHNKKRQNHQEIALEQIRKADCDILFGLGKEYFDNYADEINTTERAYINTYEDLLITDKNKVYGIFDDPLPTEGDFTLASLTSYALDSLKNDNGFFLMVEGAKIDSYGHANDIDNMLKQFWAFDEAVALALTFAEQNPNTTIIVTADHETGKLNLPKTFSEATINDKLFNSGHHTNREVPYFAYGKGASEIPAKIDNTDIFYIIKQLLFS